jgi:hypothetical protein
VSTKFYCLREPFDSLTIVEIEGRAHVTISVAGKRASFDLSKDNATRLAYAIADTNADDATCPARTTSSGLEENFRGLDPDLTLVSEYGKVVTLRRLREEAARG